MQLSDYSAKNLLNYLTGNRPMPTLPAVWLAFFTAAPADDGTGGTEVVGTGYARQQVAGTVAATASFTAATPNITMAPNPGWVVPGMNAYDSTNNQQIGTVSTYIGTALVLTGNAAHASSGSADNIVFSAFPAASASTGAEPATTPANTTNAAAITFAQAGSGGWGTVVAWGLYDAATVGNLLWADYLGNFAWLPASVSSASPGVLNAHAHGFAVNDSVVASAKDGGVVPTFSQSNFTGLLAVAHATTDTFDVTNAATAVNTSSTGDLMVRKVASQVIPANVTPVFNAGSFELLAA